MKAYLKGPRVRTGRIGVSIVTSCLAAACGMEGAASTSEEVARTEAALSTPIQFAGTDWSFKEACSVSGGYTGPGLNYWCGGSSHAFVDSAGLHLKLAPDANVGGAYAAVEVERPVDGCGTYTFEVAPASGGTPGSLNDLDKNVVLGLFTYSDDEDNEFHEVDVEISNWGKNDPANNLHYTTWTRDGSGELVPVNDSVGGTGIDRSTVNLSGVTKHSFTWEPGRLSFISTDASNNVLGQRVRPSSAAPPCPTSQAKSGMTARINLWTYTNLDQNNDGQTDNPLPSPTVPAAAQEVVIKSFTYEPYVSLVAPTNIRVTAVADTNVSLAWAEASRGEGGFEIERRVKVQGAVFAKVATVGPDVESYLDTGLSPFTKYEHRVRAVRGSTVSGYSGWPTSQTSTPIGYRFAGDDGFVLGQLPTLASPTTYRIRTWVYADGTYYHQGLDPQPSPSGGFRAPVLWGEDDGVRTIFMTAHPAANDEYAPEPPAVPEPFEDIGADAWPTAFRSDVKVFGPYSTFGYADEPELLSHGKPAWANSSLSGTSPAMAFDGNLTNFYAPRPAGGVSLRVDLGAVRDLVYVKVHSGTYWSHSYHISTSNDGAVWTGVYGDLTNTDGGVDTYYIPGKQARWVKVDARGPLSDPSYGNLHINEVQVFGSP